MKDILALIGVMHLVADLAVIGFLCWFTYDSRQTSKKLDEMYEAEDEAN